MHGILNGKHKRTRPSLMLGVRIAQNIFTLIGPLMVVDCYPSQEQF